MSNPSTQLIAYDRIDDVPAFVRQIGNDIAKSKLFGCQSIEQGNVIALECIARKMPPLMIAEKYYLIHGKLSMKAESMLADFRTASKGSHRILKRDADCAEIELITADRQSITFRLTWAEASQEPFVYDGKEAEIVAKLQQGKSAELTLKPKYATPRSRTQMLWARVVSDAVRCVAPEVVCGSYTPEEVSDFETMPEIVQNQMIPEQPEPEPEDAEIIVPETTAEEPQSGTVFDATEPAAIQEETAKAEPAEESRNTDPATEFQVSEIKRYIAEVAQTQPDIVSKVKTKLAKHSLKTLSDLNQIEADIFIEAMRRKSTAAFFEADLKGHCPKQ